MEQNQATRIHMQQDKDNAFFGVGDEIKGKCAGELFSGEVICIEVKKQGDELHAVIDLQESDGQSSFWVENITELKIIRFKGED